MTRTLAFESHSEASAQREGSEQPRYYLQMCLNSSNEKCRKYYHLYKDFQHERLSVVPGVQRLHARERQLTSEVSQTQHPKTKRTGQRQRFGSEMAGLKSEVGNSKHDLKFIRWTNDSNSAKNTKFIEQIKELTVERIELRAEVTEVSKRSSISACFDRFRKTKEEQQS